MNNIIEIDGHKAAVSLDPEIGQLRGEFLGLNGGADFYADNIGDLRKEVRSR
jgi:predicted HicB family RNase H-like nuclease